jgi:hypothetical protein
MKRPELRLIRDALEAVLSPELAAATIDEALRSMPTALSSPAELVGLVNGPLRAALAKRHGSAADDVIDDLLRMLVGRSPAPRTTSQDITRELPLESAQVFAFKPPAIVIVDGASFPSIEPSEMPSLLGGLPPTTVRAVWGTGTPYGASVIGELASKRAPFTPLDRREGVAPIVDLVRARRLAP